MSQRVTRLLPFMSWWPLRAGALRSDLIAGLTVALVLIPQSMAYSQLAGLPAYYGLYAAFVPCMVAALWGSSAQLSTGPVAVVSLLTASTLAPLAASGSEHFVKLAVLLAMMVGLIQLTLGTFRLGIVVSFLSHPVITGFTNAAAIIIGLSQLNKLFGISMGRSENFMQDVWRMLEQIGETHLPTLLMGLAAFLIMIVMKRHTPKLPNVLFAVGITTLVSWGTGFELNNASRVDYIMDNKVSLLANEFVSTEARIGQLREHISEHSTELQRFVNEGEVGQRIAAVRYELELLQLELGNAEVENRKISRSLRKFMFEQVPAKNGVPPRLFLAGQVPQYEQSDGHRWRIGKIQNGDLKLIGGGEVVGSVPSGLPGLALPSFQWNDVGLLMSGALVISLVGFMEAISIAKAMAAKTRQRIDPNQELIGQGLANVIGSLSHAFPVSGSFSRSAVNLNADAKTGLSSVFASSFVLVTLMFLTPLLYYLPQAVLAAVIIMAVVGLINFSAIKHAWQVHRHDGIAAVVTFVGTIVFAPHLDNGILLGAGLAIILYLYRTMSPRVAILGRYHDDTLRDAKVHNLPVSEHVIAIRYDGSLYFANVSYFEDAVLDAVSTHPRAKHLLIVANGINQLDATGDEAIHNVVESLRASGIRVAFSGLKKQVIDIMKHSSLFTYIGQENIFADEDKALDSIYAEVRNLDPNAKCRLLKRHQDVQE